MKILLSSILAGQIVLAQVPAPVRTKPLTKLTKAPADITGDITVNLKPPENMGPQKFTYGSTLPVVPCTYGRLCEILLAPGEFIDKAPTLGDTAHWTFEVRLFGHGDEARTTVITKLVEIPVAISSTDLIIATNRRDYHLTLAFDQSKYMPQVEFSYPEDEKRASLALYAEQVKREQAEQAAKEAHAKAVNNCEYTAIISKRATGLIVPVSVCDDNTRTTFRFQKELEKWDSPVLRVAGPGGCEVANYHQDGSTWTYDGLFERAELVLGKGRKARRVLIDRKGSKADDLCDKVRGHKVPLKGNA